jgi:predicted ribosome quality control (RQC) complex YloA/Tae2 family protein
VHQQTIAEIVKEISASLAGRFMGKIFQLSSLSLALDFGSKEAGYLFINVDPAWPRLHLIKRRVRELEKQSVAPSAFTHALRANLGGGELLSIIRDDAERVVRLSFLVEDEIGGSHKATLVAQLSGRSANLFLLDEAGHITHTLRVLRGEGQQVGDNYHPPIRLKPNPQGGPQDTPATHHPQGLRTAEEEQLELGAFPSISSAADDYYARLEAAAVFTNRSKTLLTRLQKEIAQGVKLKSNLTRDLITHGDPGQLKRMGDLLLANIANARREGNTVTLTDYYSEDAPEIEIEVDENSSLQDEAARYFARYTKAKRGAEEIATRLAQLEREMPQLLDRRAELERIISSRDEDALAILEGSKAPALNERRKRKKADKIPGVRRYRSSDGYEILVGRAAHTNDHLTFRVALPYDLWLHAADYPGSHVVIRNQTRKEIPHRTIIEAAQLAAKFSQASSDSKVTIHYTSRKFLSKPKGGAPGLVRMSSFKTITVEPKESIDRIETGQ